ncbi:MAG TPA: transposase, partial [Acidimicrobiales bacterium]|nr:transposase [Acidimicrobiales bacterium]
RVGGQGGWLWTVSDPATTVYAIEDSRGAEVIRLLLGDDYAGVVVRDGWAPLPAPGDGASPDRH